MGDKPPGCGETEYRLEAEKLARTIGYVVTHPPNCRQKSGKWSQASNTGWPDSTFMRPPRMFFVEFKGPKTIITAEQQAMIELLRACGQEVYVWRSTEVSYQQIAEALVRRAR